MKPLIFTYCEGNDTKVAVLVKEKEKIKLLKAYSFDVVQPSIDLEEGISDLKLDSGALELEGLENEVAVDEQKAATSSSLSLMSDSLKDVNLNNAFFIPVLTEPAIYYHNFESTGREKSSKLTQEIITDIQESKNVTIDKENLGYLELSDKSLLAVFINGEVGCIKLINSLARYNGKRYYKIPSVKSAELSIAYYVAKKKKFFPDDQSLIVYIGKEYSKLIFLQGRKLKHIGNTLDIGTINLHTYDVYFSKILLEMENGGISSLDNIIVCGEDDSENLILSFYGTFPEANVSRLEFDDLQTNGLDQDTKEQLSSFSVPISAAIEYFDEENKEHKGINLLPRYVREEQKFLQFGWHGYLMLPILFVATFLITQKVLVNANQISKLNEQITTKTILQRKNQQTLNKISDFQTKINNFSQTQAILDSASAGTGVWTKVMKQISGFLGSHRNLWLTKLTKSPGGSVVMEGYALSKNVLTDFAYSIKKAQLKSVMYESLRDNNAYKFNITFNTSSFEEGAK